MNNRAESDGEHSRRKFRHIERAIHQLEQRLTTVTVATDNLNTAIAALQAEDKIVVQSIADLLAKITAASTDPVVQAAADQINAEVATLAASVATANPPTT